MKALDSKVNIIPVVAKADTITKGELHKFKIRVGCVAYYVFPTFSSIRQLLNKYLTHIS